MHFSRKNNLYFIAGSILFFLASAALIAVNIKMYRERTKLSEQIEGYKKQVQEIKEGNSALKEQISKANNDDYIEKIAREELNLQKQGEKVVSFVAPPKQQIEEKKQQSFWEIWLAGFMNWFRR